MLILLRIDSFDEKLIIIGDKIKGKRPGNYSGLYCGLVTGWYCGD
jgi:hypothetical protein